jgi:hypothetical protein
MDYTTTIPIPTDRDAGNAKYPFRSMPVGASVLVAKSEYMKIKSASATFKTRNPGWRYTIRTTKEGVRLWRTA